MRPHAYDHMFFYGVNFEFSVNHHYWESRTITSEEYAGFGPLHDFLPVNQQFQEVWAVMDHNSKIVNIEAGVGVGYTGGADRLTFKLMLSRDLNSRSTN